MLHITNGASVSLAQTGLPGEIIYWNDILHEGPVPDGLSLTELSRVREQFLTGYFAQPASFAARDEALQGFRAHEEVTLWFEHDLYDQLQLLQLLDWFSHQQLELASLSLICVDRYLGSLSPEQLIELFPHRHEVTTTEVETAQAAWHAFCSASPIQILDLIGRARSLSALPFLEGALLRHLEQFPGAQDGLSRTARQALQSVSEGLRTLDQLFLANQRSEERIFMGDTVFREYLHGLRNARLPLLRGGDEELELTEFGRKVLAGQADHIQVNGIECWRGGVHLHAGAPLWRWCGTRRTIAR